MTSPSIVGLTALVTGASGGLGADFARELARRGCALILVARRQEQLEALRDEIVAQHGVSVELIPLDLVAPGATQQLQEQVEQRGLTVDILVNNAGYGLYGSFATIDWEREQAMLLLDIVVPVDLTKRFLPGMLARRRGYLMQIASIGAYQPSPLYATYSAAKSFILNWGEALSFELRGTGVSCTVVSPGITATEFLKVAGQRATLYQRLAMMQSPDVVRIGVEAMLKGRPSVVTGTANAIAAWSNRLVPRRLQARLAHRLMT